MNENRTDKTRKISQQATKHLAMWGFSGLLAGIAIGIIIGIGVYYQSQGSLSGSFTIIKDTSYALGLPLFNSITQSTMNFLSQEKISAKTDLFKEVLSAKFKNDVENNKTYNSKQETANPKSILSNIFNSTEIQTNPEIISSKVQTSSQKIYPSNQGNYKDGYGTDDINIATSQQLDKIPRLSASIIKEIVLFIQTKGPIKSFDQFLEIKGVGDKTVEKLRQYFHIK